MNEKKFKELEENHDCFKEVSNKFLVEYYQQIKFLYDSVETELVYRLVKNKISNTHPDTDTTGTQVQ